MTQPQRPAWMPPRPACDPARRHPYLGQVVTVGPPRTVCNVHGYTWLDGHAYCNGVPEAEERLHDTLDALVRRLEDLGDDWEVRAALVSRSARRSPRRNAAEAQASVLLHQAASIRAAIDLPPEDYPPAKTGDDGLTPAQRAGLAQEWRETGARKPDRDELARIIDAIDETPKENP